MKKNKKDKTLENMMAHPAKIIRYYDFDNKQIIECPVCGWSGLPDGYKNYYNDLFDVCCPKCDKMILIVGYPTEEETKEAANKGNQEAKENLSVFSVRNAFMQNFEEKKLKGPDELPDIEGEKLDFIFDAEDKPDDLWNENALIICNGEIIWKEPLLYECWLRFNQIREILIKKYGRRFNSFKPTRAAELNLYGDDLGAPDKIILG
jgi:hypothetical protein